VARPGWEGGNKHRACACLKRVAATLRIQVTTSDSGATSCQEAPARTRLVATLGNNWMVRVRKAPVGAKAVCQAAPTPPIPGRSNAVAAGRRSVIVHVKRERTPSSFAKAMRTRQLEGCHLETAPWKIDDDHFRRVPGQREWES
jgi:hypothetical protein